MGRKVHPYGFRLGFIKDWQSRWYAERGRYTNLLDEDRKIRAMIRKDIPKAAISAIEIERQRNYVHVWIHTAKPGIIIGRKGANVNLLRNTTEAFSAVVGGADSLHVASFDEVLGGAPSDLGRRIARNTQLMLREESKLDHVVDLGGGSWYIERLTHEVAQAA